MSHLPLRLSGSLVVTAAMLAVGGTAGAARPEVETEIVPPVVYRVAADRADHPLTIGPEVDEFHDLLVTSDGDVVVASAHDGRVPNGDFDAWPMRVWTVGQPGFSEVLVPTAASGLAEGPDGSLYLAGEGRFLARFVDTAWEVLAAQQDVAPYRAHVVADDGSVFAAFGQTLYEFDGEGWRRSDVDDRGMRVTNLERSADGRLWLHIADRLLTSSGDGWTEMQPTGAAPGQVIRTLAIDTDPNGRLWAMLDNGIGACDPVVIPVEMLDWAPLTQGLEPRVSQDAGRQDRKPRRCGFGGVVVVGVGGAWAVEGRSLRDLLDSIGSVSVGGPHIAMAEADGDGRIWVLAPDEDPETSDVYVIETGSGG